MKMQRVHIALVAVLGAGLVVLACLFSSFLGFEIAKRKITPYGLFDKVHKKIERLEKRLSPPAPRTDVFKDYKIDTALLTLHVQSSYVGVDGIPYPQKHRNYGGALTSLGDQVLLLTNDGSFYAAHSAKDIHRTGIRAPDRHLDAYLRAQQSEALAGYQHLKDALRYDDILVIQADAQSWLLASYTEFHEEALCYTSTLARVPLTSQNADELNILESDWQVVLRTRPCLPLKAHYNAIEGHMAGGRMAFSPPHTLYITSGDYHIDGMRSNLDALAQNPDVEYGKILAIDTRTWESRVFTTGNRNPQGLLLAPDGTLYSTEHGPKGGDELNILIEGHNYGWPLESYGTAYSGGMLRDATTFGRHDHYTAPLFAWVPSPAISNLAFLENFNPHWDGDLLAGSLKGGSLYRLRLQQGRVAYSEQVSFGGDRLRYVHQHSDGRIVIWTDNYELLFVEGVERDTEDNLRKAFFAENTYDALVAMKIESTLASCQECHAMVGAEDLNAPPLQHIFNSSVASTHYRAYSEALATMDATWTREALSAFLVSPGDFAPGTRMPPLGLSDGPVLEGVIDYLEYINNQY